jgi:sec-independent protein translocase protein TatA
MLGGLGASGVILLVIVALLLFGPNKLPELGRAFGKTLREFKNGAKDIMEDDPKPERKEASRIETVPAEEQQQASRRLPE